MLSILIPYFARLTESDRRVRCANQLRDIQADNVEQPERRAVGQADQRPGEGVDFFNRVPVLDRDLRQSPQKREADPVADEVRRVLARHHAFPQPQIPKARNEFEQRRIGLRSRNHFQQVQISRRVEKMRSQEPPPEPGRKSFRDLPQRTADSSPCLGADTEDVLVNVLGRSPADVAALVDKGICK